MAHWYAACLTLYCSNLICHLSPDICLCTCMCSGECVYVGHQQVHQARGQHTILMDSSNKFHKVLVKESPGPPDTWFPDHQAATHGTDRTETKRYERGLLRWKQLPQPIDVIIIIIMIIIYNTCNNNNNNPPFKYSTLICKAFQRCFGRGES